MTVLDTSVSVLLLQPNAILLSAWRDLLCVLWLTLLCNNFLLGWSYWLIEDIHERLFGTFKTTGHLWNSNSLTGMCICWVNRSPSRCKKWRYQWHAIAFHECHCLASSHPVHRGIPHSPNKENAYPCSRHWPFKMASRIIQQNNVPIFLKTKTSTFIKVTSNRKILLYLLTK